jgi:hypothetical protein
MGCSVNHQRGGFQRVNFRVISSPLEVKVLISAEEAIFRRSLIYPFAWSQVLLFAFTHTNTKNGDRPHFLLLCPQDENASFLQNEACPHFFVCPGLTSSFYFGSIIGLKYYKDWQII